MNKDQYFFRCVIFSRNKTNVAIADIYNPSQISELEPWFGTVISLADGQHTLQELIDYLSAQYDETPTNLEETVASVIERLIEGKMILLNENKVDLPYYLANPIEELDIDKAKTLIEKDGYVFH
jgi:hypothetical protein